MSGARDQIDLLTGRTHDLEEQLAAALRDAAEARREAEDALRYVGAMRARSDYLEQREHDLCQLLAGAKAERDRLGKLLERGPVCTCGSTQAQRDRENAARAQARAAAIEAENALARAERRPVVVDA